MSESQKNPHHSHFLDELRAFIEGDQTCPPNIKRDDLPYIESYVLGFIGQAEELLQSILCKLEELSTDEAPRFFYDTDALLVRCASLINLLHDIYLNQFGDEDILKVLNFRSLVPKLKRLEARVRTGPELLALCTHINTNELFAQLPRGSHAVVDDVINPSEAKPSQLLEEALRLSSEARRTHANARRIELSPSGSADRDREARLQHDYLARPEQADEIAEFMTQQVGAIQALHLHAKASGHPNYTTHALSRLGLDPADVLAEIHRRLAETTAHARMEIALLSAGLGAPIRYCDIGFAAQLLREENPSLESVRSHFEIKRVLNRLIQMLFTNTRGKPLFKVKTSYLECGSPVFFLQLPDEMGRPMHRIELDLFDRPGKKRVDNHAMNMKPPCHRGQDSPYAVGSYSKVVTHFPPSLKGEDGNYYLGLKELRELLHELAHAFMYNLTENRTGYFADDWGRRKSEREVLSAVFERLVYHPEFLYELIGTPLNLPQKQAILEAIKALGLAKHINEWGALVADLCNHRIHTDWPHQATVATQIEFMDQTFLSVTREYPIGLSDFSGWRSYCYMKPHFCDPQFAGVTFCTYRASKEHARQLTRAFQTSEQMGAALSSWLHFVAPHGGIESISQKSEEWLNGFNPFTLPYEHATRTAW